MLTPERLRTALQTGLLALLVLAPLPFGSVQRGAVLAIELTAACLGLVTILLIGVDDEASSSVPKLPLAICSGLTALGLLQLVPIPFRIAERFNPTTDLARPLIPYLGLDHLPTVSWSVAAPETTDALLRFVAYVLIGLSAAVAFNTDRSRRRFAVVLVASAVFQAAYGSGEYLSGRQHIFAFAKKYYLDSATGTLINRNHFATLLAMTLPFALALALPERAGGYRDGLSLRERLVSVADRGGLARLLALGASAAVWMGLLLSHSRAGLLAAVVGAAIMLFRFRRQSASRWAGAIGAGVLLILLSAELAQAPGERFVKVIEDIRLKGGRLTVWRDTLGLIRARPVLGWGYGTFDNAFPMVQSEEIGMRYDHAHNEWIEWTAEGGVVALGAAILLLGLSLRRTAEDVAGRGFHAGFKVACQAALVSVALHVLWDFSLRIPAVAVAYAAVVGIAVRGRALAETLRPMIAHPPPVDPRTAKMNAR